MISVIVPCRGNAEDLERCLGALWQQTLREPYEIVVANSEHETAVASVAARFPDVRLVFSRKGLTPGEARNLGVRSARAGWLAFIDSDCIPDHDWLAAALVALRAGAMIVGGAVRDGRPLNPIAVADNLLQFLEFSPHRPNGTVSRFPTANCAMQRATYDELGGFPTGLATGSDALFNRAAAKRWPDGIVFTRTMRVRHSGRTDLRSFWKHQELLGVFRGRLGVGLGHPAYQRLGCHAIFAIPIMGKRLSFLVMRTIRYNPVGLLRIVILLPILLVGLVAWAGAFRTGCRLAVKEAA